jgi:MFS family permease
MAVSDTSHNESDPLLPRREDREDEMRPREEQVLGEGSKQTTVQRLTILLPCLLILVCVLVGSAMIDVPLKEISEAIICRDLFGPVPVPVSDPRCKGSRVQSELALINGWEITFGLLPGLLVGVPYGLAADKFGRRVVLLLATIGVAMSTLAVIIICEHHFRPLLDINGICLCKSLGSVLYRSIS